MTAFFPNTLSAYPTLAPYVAQIPKSFVQGDSAMWLDVPFRDVNGVSYDPGSYALKYTLAGPSNPIVLQAIADGSNWQTSLDVVQSAALTAGKYWWTAQLFSVPALSTRITLATGELQVLPDLSRQGAGFDNRTTAEKGLANAETALAQFQATGGVVKAYTIGNRHMEYQNLIDLRALVTDWRTRVQAEKLAANPSQRMILTSFRRAR